MVILLFIRLKKNNSGSISVLLVSSERVSGGQPYPRIIKHFGVVKTEQELSNLKIIAQQYLDSIIANDNAIPKIISKESKILTIKSSKDINFCYSEIIGFKDLYGKLFKKIFIDTGLHNISNTMLGELAVMRIIKPKSKLYTANISNNFGYSLNVDRIYKFMDRITEEVISNIKTIGYQNTKKLLSDSGQQVEILFYDLTTIYFEVNSQDELRDFGFSKDGKHQHVQIVLAIIVTTSGLPISYEIFQGNTYEGHTLIPTILEVKKKYNINRIVVIADSGLINKANIAALNEAKLEYIIGARLKNSSKKVLKVAFEEDGFVNLNEDVKYKIFKFDKSEDQLIIYHSIKRAKKDAYDRDLAIKKIKKHVGSSAKNKLAGVLRKPYVSITEDSYINIDEDKLKEANKFDGYFAIQTNIAEYDPKDILDNYKDLYQIEQTFRISKYNLKIRPVFHYSPHRVKAHFAICYVALVLVRTLEFQTKQKDTYIPIEKLHELLLKVSTIKIVSKGKDFKLTTDFPKELRNIYKCFDIKEPSKFVSL
jgi:transposase